MRHASSDGAGAAFCVCGLADGLAESGAACTECGRGSPGRSDRGDSVCAEPCADAGDAAPCAADACASDDACAAIVDSGSPAAAAPGTCEALPWPSVATSAGPSSAG